MTDTRAQHSLASATAVGREMRSKALIFEDVGDADVFDVSKVSEVLAAEDGHDTMINNRVRPRNRDAEKLITIDVLELCREVSVIGMHLIVEPSVSKWRRLIWILLLLVGTAATGYQIQMQVVYFMSWPTNVNVHVDYVDSMRFPTITICNENRVRKETAQLLQVVQSSSTDCVKWSLASLVYDEYMTSRRNDDSLPILTLIKKLFSPVPDASFKPDFSIASYEPYGRVNDWSFYYKFIAQPIQNAVVWCMFNQELLNKETELHTANTNSGFGFSFNCDGSNYTSMQPGAVTGFQVMLSTEEDEYVYANSLAAGFRVLIHTEDDIPLMEERGFTISPGYITKVAVEAQYIIELPSPYSDCSDVVNYTQSICLAKCEADYVIELCKCKHVFMPGNASVCGPVVLGQCVEPAIDNYTSTNAAKQCKCPRQCRQLSYSYGVSQAPFSDLAINWARHFASLKVTNDVFRRNYAYLQVFFTDLKYTYIESSAAYSPFSLMSDIGGSLGLFLGSSLLTLFELVDVAVFAVSRIIAVRWDRKRRVTNTDGGNKY